MNKYILALVACIAVTISNAQTTQDALLYSSEELYGTARYKAMSGAFGALGGDLSAMSINPAGSAVFNNGYGTISLGLSNVDNSTTYFDGNTYNSYSNLDVTQAGAVLIFVNRNENSNWKKFSLGFNYNKLSDLSNEFVARGTSNNSIDSYFLNYAQGVPLNMLQTLPDETISELYSYLGESEGFGAQQALLGYQGYVFNADSEDPENTSYSSAIAAGEFDQNYTYISTGLNGKFSFNMATEYQDKFYFGLNLNSHFINYERYTELYETNVNPNSETNEVNFQNNLATLGSGFSFQLGGIAKLTEGLRIGATYESPTWLTINEETTQSIATYSEEFDETVIVQPDVVNIFPKYRIKTPSKYTGSLAYVFGDKGLISFDYSYKDYGNTRFRPKNDPVFMEENNFIAENLKAASTYSVGAEYRIREFSLRGGYRYVESPYENEVIVGDLNGYSLGLGYDFGKLDVGFAYNTASQDRQHQLYNVGLTNSANIQRDSNHYTLSLSFEL